MSKRRIEVRVEVVLSLVAVPSDEASSPPDGFITSFDPVSGAAKGIFKTGPAIIKLPIGASHSVVLDLGGLLWSLSSDDVVAPMELWKLNAWGEFKVRVRMRRLSPEPDRDDSIGCDAVIVRIPKG